MALFKLTLGQITGNFKIGKLSVPLYQLEIYNDIELKVKVIRSKNLFVEKREEGQKCSSSLVK